MQLYHGEMINLIQNSAAQYAARFMMVCCDLVFHELYLGCALVIGLIFDCEGVHLKLFVAVNSNNVILENSGKWVLNTPFEESLTQRKIVLCPHITI